MLFNTTRVFPYTGSHYAYRRVTSADGRVTTNQYDTSPTTIRFSMTSDLALGGATTVTGSDLGSVFIYSRSKLQIDSIIEEIYDSQGKLMYEGGGQWKVTMSAPFLGPMGIQDGYKYRLAQTKGNI